MCNKGFMDKIKQDLKIGSLVTETLYNRLSKEEKKNEEVFKSNLLSYLRLRSFRFNNLENIEEIELASSELAKKIEENKRIVLVTDYDCDGIGCAAVGTRYFRDILNYNNYEVYVNRRRYGNGVNFEILETIPDLEKIDVFITADHGSVDSDRYLLLKEKNPNMLIIVTDHHTFPEYPKYCDYFINNQREDIKYFKEFSGCAIFCCLLQAVTNKIVFGNKLEEARDLFLSFMALTIVSDVMSLKNLENRYIVKKGVPKLYRLLELDPNNVDLTFKLIPMINSGNRMHNELLSYKLLTEKDSEKRMVYYTELSELNEFRKEITKRITENLVVNKDPVKCVMIDTEFGVNGLIAARLADQYDAPAFVLQDDGSGELHGSSRGNGYNVLEILSEAESRGLVIRFGGHEQAAGFTVDKKKYQDFFNFVVTRKIKKQRQEIKHDVELKDVNITKILLTKSTLSPYGKDFEEPVFKTELTFEKIHSSNGDDYNMLFSNKSKTFFTKFKNIKKINMSKFFVQGKKYDVKFEVRSSLTNPNVGYMNILEIKEKRK